MRSFDFDIQSGPRAWRPLSRPLIEDALALDLADPAVRGVLSDESIVCGVISFQRAGVDVHRIQFVWNGLAQTLELAKPHDGAAARTSVRVVSSRPHFGGMRRWFVCPQTGARVRTLYSLQGGQPFLSRHAHGLVYRSTRRRLAFPSLLAPQATPTLFERSRGLDEDLAADIVELLREEKRFRRHAARLRRNGIRRLRRRERKDRARGES